MHQIPRTVHLTKDGLKDIQEELDNLVQVKRPKAVDRIARARDFGDLTENSEYHQAREELSFIDGRIDELEEITKKAVVVDGKPTKGEIGVGCKVTLSCNGQKHTYTIVGEWEADPKEKKISHQSPLGQALVGKKVGDKVELEAPAGKVVYEVHKIH